MAKRSWNELQDDGPLEVRVDKLSQPPREQTVPSRSLALRLAEAEARLDALESKWDFSLGRVVAFILVLLVGPTVLTLFVLFLMNRLFTTA